MARVELYQETAQTWMETTDGLVRAVALGKWRWRFISNGHIMADSGQGYSRRIDCLNGAATVLGGTFYKIGLNAPSPGIYRRRNNVRKSDEHIPVIDLTKAARDG